MLVFVPSMWICCRQKASSFICNTLEDETPKVRRIVFSMPSPQGKQNIFVAAIIKLQCLIQRGLFRQYVYLLS